MINLRVMNLSDIIKYLIKLAIMIVVIIISVRIITNKSRKSEETKKNEKLENSMIAKANINFESMTYLLDFTIPKIKEVNKKANSDAEGEHEEKEKIEPLKIPLQIGLQMMGNVVLKQEKEEKKVKEGNIVKEEKVEQAQTGISTQPVKNSVPDKYTDSYQGVQVKNGTSYQLTEEMLKPDITVNNKNLIIFQSHTCESYTATEKFNYAQTGAYRTTDLNYNVARVGTELTNQLKSYQFNVFHDMTYHDYPAYNGSYDRSLNTVQGILQKDMQADVVIDIHRDAIGDYSYAPKVKIGEEYAAQLMFVIGTNGGGLEHSNWNQNLKFAIKVQQKANELYPGLFKSIVLRNSRYNQHVAKAASIIEVGATRKYNGRMFSQYEVFIKGYERSNEIRRGKYTKNYCCFHV